MVRKSEKVEPLSIKKIEPIIFINLKSYEIDVISKSIKDIGYEPLIVRSKSNGKFQLCSHLEIFEALKQLHKDKIDVIIRKITEQQGKELAIASLLSRPDIPCKDQELLVWTIRNSGSYKSDALGLLQYIDVVIILGTRIQLLGIMLHPIQLIQKIVNMSILIING